MIVSINVGSLENGGSRNRAFNYVNRDYVGTIGTSTSGGTISGVVLPNGYDSFWEWARAIGQGINSLSLNTYIGTIVNASWDTNEEVEG